MIRKNNIKKVEANACSPRPISPMGPPTPCDEPFSPSANYSPATCSRFSPSANCSPATFSRFSPSANCSPAYISYVCPSANYSPAIISCVCPSANYSPAIISRFVHRRTIRRHTFLVLSIGELFAGIHLVCLSIGELFAGIHFVCLSVGELVAAIHFVYLLGYEWSLISSRKMGNEMWYLIAKKRMQQMAKKVTMEMSPTLTSSLKSSQ